MIDLVKLTRDLDRAWICLVWIYLILAGEWGEEFKIR
jgi:hypothetical protein